MSEIITFTEAIRLGTEAAMLEDPRVHVLGLGVSYPNGADGTLTGLALKFPDRIHDVPCSEAAITGVALGMAINGLKPIAHHGRIEFALYAAHFIITEASNWNYMFGGDYRCPMVVRVCVGRQWGNGPVHTRSMRGLFAAPGLKVVCPSSPKSARALLLAAIDDPNPVVYLEHRWLYKVRGDCGDIKERQSLDKAVVLLHGTDVTIVAVGDAVLEALYAARALSDYDIQAEVIDLVSIYPVDMETIIASARKTRVVVVADTATPAYGCCNEIIGNLSKLNRAKPAMKFASVTAPDAACPTAPELAASYYPADIDITNCVLNMFGIKKIEPLTARSFNELNLPPTVNIDELL